MRQGIIVAATSSCRGLVSSCIAVAMLAVQACSAHGDDELAAPAIEGRETTPPFEEAASALGTQRLAQSASCNIVTDCDDGNECTQEACVNDVCVITVSTPGSQCSGGACDAAGQCLAIPPSCDPALCDDGNECTQEACVNDACLITVSPAGSQCSGGACDGAGQCFASGCSNALDCLPGQLCLAGVCGFIL